MAPSKMFYRRGFGINLFIPCKREYTLLNLVYPCVMSSQSHFAEGRSVKREKGEQISQSRLALKMLHGNLLKIAAKF